MNTGSPGLTRVYFPGGRVAHLMNPVLTNVTLCHRWAVWAHGTGSQDEYEKAEWLTLCKFCQRKAPMWRATS